jgi:AbrB family looped-hinge helix DNA binding protein
MSIKQEQRVSDEGKKGKDSSSTDSTLNLFTDPNIQIDMVRRMLSLQMDAMQNFANMLQILTRFNAVFKTTVQSNGRISIPEAERKALGIDEGDLVQVIIIPLEKGKGSNTSKKD